MCPLTLALDFSLTYGYRILGWSALSGVVVIILAYIVNYPLAIYNVSVCRVIFLLMFKDD